LEYLKKECVAKGLVASLILGLFLVPYIFAIGANSFSLNPASSQSLLRYCSAYSPCPMGLADYGFNEGSTYQYSAVAFYSRTNFTSLSIGASSVPGMGIQLNVIEKGVAEGKSQGTYWTQDVMHVAQNSATSFTLQAENNIWNFASSSSTMGSDFFPNLLHECVFGGTAGDGSNGEYYYCYGPQVTVSLPFSVALEMRTGSCSATLCGSSRVGDSYVEFW
jgi:hypothetical protein